MKKLLIILLLLPIACFSQKKKTKIYPHVILSGGIAGGEKQTAPVAQLSAGISFGPWFSGLGVGYDYYRFNTIPVYADWRFSFGPDRILYVYANPGVHLLQPTGSQLETIWARKAELKPGFFGEGGVGFRVKAGRYHHLGLSIGYRYRQMTHRTDLTPPWISSRPTTMGELAKDRYSFTTIVSRLTWEFGR